MLNKPVELCIDVSVTTFSNGKRKVQMMHTAKGHRGAKEYWRLDDSTSVFIAWRINGKDALPTAELRQQCQEAIAHFTSDIIEVRKRRKPPLIHRSVELSTS